MSKQNLSPSHLRRLGFGPGLQAQAADRDAGGRGVLMPLSPEEKSRERAATALRWAKGQVSEFWEGFMEEDLSDEDVAFFESGAAYQALVSAVDAAQKRWEEVK